MLTGHSALASVALGGDSGPETPPVATIVLAGVPPAEDINCPTASITLSGLLGDGEANTWAMDFYPTPTAISLSASYGRPAAASATPLASIALAGRLGTPVALSSPPIATVTLSGLLPSNICLVSLSTTPGISLSALVGNPFIGSTTSAAGLALTGLEPNTGNLHAAPTASIVLVANTPQPLAATSTPNATISVSGLVPAPAVLTRLDRAIIWLSALPLVEAGELTAGTVVILNANTLAVSEYSIAALDIVEYEGNLYFVKATELVVLDPDVYYDAGYIQTGQIDFGSTTGKRCTSVVVDTEASTPSVSLVDQALTVYPTTARSGAGTKRQREYNAPRGVLSNRFGLKISGDYIDVGGVSISISESMRK